MDELSTVSVFCRMRPFIQREINMGNLVYPIRIDGDKVRIDEKSKNYNFDRSFDQSSNQVDIFNEIGRSGVRDFIEGFNVTQFAYGQSGCLEPNTDVMMFDGTTKKAKDIKIGDVLMGDDSTSRNVLELFEGEQSMYEIVPERGDSYIVNEDHVLTLVYIVNPFIQWCGNYNRYKVRRYQDGRKRVKTFQVHGNDVKPRKGIYNRTKEEFLSNIPNCNKTIDITVKEYLQKSPTWKRFHLGLRCPVEFIHKEVPIDPYILGLWLGDGCSISTAITTVDPEIVEYMHSFAQKIDCKVTRMKCNSKETINYRISCLEWRNNPFFKFLKEYDLIKNKHIPNLYKYNDKETRLQLLAGLLDSDGHYDMKKGSYDFIQNNEKLFDDVIWLSRSLGFECYKSKCEKTCTNGKNGPVSGTYYRCNIGGITLHEIPCKIPRKQAKHRENSINYALHVGINVKPVGIGKYNGFRLDGNHRFLLGDFTCTHNSGKTFSMMGKKGDSRLEGIIPRSIKEIFNIICNKPDGWSFEIEVSYLEIYMERVNDLLDHSKQNLQIRQDNIHGIYVQGLTHENVANPEDVYELLKKGDSIRKVTATKLNEGSSRSHSILTLYLTQIGPDKSRITSQLNLVDLAGSERADKTKATGEVLKQGALINLSLTILSQVIHALSNIEMKGGVENDRGSTPIPYRDSKLTRLLQSSLGGNSKTSLIIHVSPHIDNIDESMSTLEFGKRTKLVKNKATRRIQKSAAQLEDELSKLRGEYNLLLESVNSGEIKRNPELLHSVSFTSANITYEKMQEKVGQLEEEMCDLISENSKLKKEIETFEDLFSEIGEGKNTNNILRTVKHMKEENNKLKVENYTITQDLMEKASRLANAELECLRNNISLKDKNKKNKKIRLKVRSKNRD